MKLRSHSPWQFAAIVAILIGSIQSRLPGSAPPNKALAGDAPHRLYVVTHIDLIPPQATPGKAILLQFAADTRKDPGAVRVELLQDVSRPNHFTLTTVWNNQELFDQHLALAHTRTFRTRLQPMLGSPFDERLHHLVPQ